MSQIYVLENEYPKPANIDQFNDREDKIPHEARCALGQRLKTDYVGHTSIVTYFVSAPVGWHHRRPLCFLTMTTGQTTKANAAIPLCEHR